MKVVKILSFGAIFALQKFTRSCFERYDLERGIVQLGAVGFPIRVEPQSPVFLSGETARVRATHFDSGLAGGTAADGTSSPPARSPRRDASQKTRLCTQ